METAVNSLVTALTTSISTYTSYIGSGIVDIFKYLFLQVDSNGTVIGFNFLGYTAVILLGFGMLIMIITIFIHKITDSYRIKQLNSMNSDIKQELMDEWYEDFKNDYKNSYRDLVYEYMDDIYNEK